MCGANVFKSLTKKASGQARKNGNKGRVPMYSIEHIQNELDKVFIDCVYKVGEPPFEDGDWREFGATGEMIIKYCQKLNINCYVHHGRNLLTYMAPNIKQVWQLSTSASGATMCIFMDQTKLAGAK